jgi:hypothetical protein
VKWDLRNGNRRQFHFKVGQKIQSTLPPTNDGSSVRPVETALDEIVLNVRFAKSELTQSTQTGLMHFHNTNGSFREKIVEGK